MTVPAPHDGAREEERERGPRSRGETSGSGPAHAVHDILVMNHRGAALGTAVKTLREAGFEVRETTFPAESLGAIDRRRPHVVLLCPLVEGTEGVEIEMVERFQSDDEPLPVILVLGDAAGLGSVRRFREGLFHDFVLEDSLPDEVVARVRLALVKRDKVQALRTHARELESQVIRDFKTGLYTERHFRALLRQEYQRAERHRTPLSFLLVDIDNFKQINDRAEYAFGDEVLGSFAEVLRNNVREIDHAGRFGGDEFMVLLPQTTAAEAVEVAARLLNVAGRKEISNGRYTVRITISIGIASYDGRSASSPEDLRRQANAALKMAKTRGKNRIWLWSPDMIDPAGPGEATGAGPADTGSAGAGPGSTGTGSTGSGPTGAGRSGSGPIENAGPTPVSG